MPGCVDGWRHAAQKQAEAAGDAGAAQEAAGLSLAGYATSFAREAARRARVTAESER